jgi:sarcosine oxidase
LRPTTEGGPDPALVDRVAEWVSRTYLDADPEPVAAETCIYTTTPDERFILERRGRVVIGSACSRPRLQVRARDRRRLAQMAADSM